MNNPVFIEIKKFDSWAKSQNDTSQDDIGGEWECNYENWDKIYTTFKNFLNQTDSNNWSETEKELLLYIIARDNESGYLANLLNESALIILAKHSVIHGKRDDKWQLAIQLHKLSDLHLATTLLEQFEMTMKNMLTEEL